jgi:putative PEP-CTERM system integral membrane protein
LDPALVEQIGPRQYRLRAFPVEPKRLVPNTGTDSRLIEEGPPLHLWLTFRVLANGNSWTMPRLAEKRNVYWDATSVRLVNGRSVDSGARDWLPLSVTATAAVKPVSHRIDFPGGTTVFVRPVSPDGLPRLAGNLHLAIVLDRSRSMGPRAEDVKATLARLSQIADPDTDVYLTSSPYRGEAPSRIHLSQLRPDNLQYLAGQNAGELLVQYDTLRASQEYDAIFVITDGSGYELGASDLPVPVPQAPVWVIHLGGGMPLGYDDGTLAAIQASGGGVTGEIEDALNRLAVSRSSQTLAAADVPAGAMADWSDGYLWFISIGPASSGNTAGTADDGFAAFAARRLILAETQRQRATLASTGALDPLHAIAVKYSVVTPYSSMIVLVNSRQEQLLNRLEESSDRFSREVEGVGGTLGANPFMVTGVPEPGEWLLLGSAAALLIGYVYIKRRQFRLI